ncbi:MULTISPECIES: exonuclease subunit SbcD [unclassified Arsukibacterium]|uniref:exonuclease subunit SbcD n=1 Tax=unclassified Arsukibacterium TaxID=2635278 RepID=UPI000C3587E6|nr:MULTISPECIES: exonuclease subunit SbcD [unclassified Arsukibacterium]MAA94617.1 exonuclease subunit SbcD [Rheinheimera sp.]MBM32799.1 exonuclease subunit SbcD [Rheinheimera sp.]HAW93380.1 exonuclease subunit SbcD [Candidatus Azambacteria bacterium]|tara:strand:+ start:47060 stop:48319 length:1260 start_codon:yes stop_codon:yes gene_type:complete
MRILHTSDWHLGQHFIGKSRAAEHAAFMRWLVAQVDELSVDAIIVAGDIFDTATPPSYARELYNQFIVELQPSGCQLVILGGNHDSPAVLAESKQLLTKLNTRVIPTVQADVSEQIVILNDSSGQPACVLAAVPFLRSRDVLQSQAGQSGQQKQADLQQAIARHYQQLFELAQQYNQQHQLQLPVIMTGHLTTVGVSQSESVRDIYIGTLEAFSASQFPAADYIALGHIHQAQQLNSSTDIRYSGSPIALSFDEARQQKQLWLIEFNNQQKTVSSIVIPCFQPLASIKTDLVSLPGMVTPLLAKLTEGATLWLEVVISASDGYLTDLQPRVEQLLADQPVELLKLRRERNSSGGSLQQLKQTSLAELAPADVWQARLAEETLTAEQQQQLSALHQQALAKVQDAAQQAESESQAGLAKA